MQLALRMLYHQHINSILFCICNYIVNIWDLYRSISDFKKGYQPRCNIVNDEKGDLVANSHGIVARWWNYFSQLFNVHGVKDVGQAEKHTAEPLVPEPSAHIYGNDIFS